MSESLRIAEVPYQYEVEADAGVSLSSGELWWGTRIRYRPGTTGKWLHFIAIDVHPFDHEAVAVALTTWIEHGTPESMSEQKPDYRQRLSEHPWNAVAVALARRLDLSTKIRPPGWPNAERRAPPSPPKP